LVTNFLSILFGIDESYFTIAAKSLFLNSDSKVGGKIKLEQTAGNDFHSA